MSKVEEALSQLNNIISNLEERLSSKDVSADIPPPVGPESSVKKTTVSKDKKKPAKVVHDASGKNEDHENFEKSLLQVALIDEIETHPASDKLFVCKVEYEPGKVCQVLTGLQKFYKIEELTKKKVVIIKNLKPAKLAGMLSEAMILAGSVPTEDGGEIVKVLEPVPSSSIGDRVYLEGSAPSESPNKQLSSKVWEKIVGKLQVLGGKAVFAGKTLVSSSGEVIVPNLPDGAGIH